MKQAEQKILLISDLPLGSLRKHLQTISSQFLESTGTNFEFIYLEEKEQHSIPDQLENATGIIVFINNWRTRRLIREKLFDQGGWYVNPCACLFHPYHYEFDLFGKGLPDRSWSPSLRAFSKWLVQTAKEKASRYPQFIANDYSLTAHLSQSPPKENDTISKSSILIEFTDRRNDELIKPLMRAWLLGDSVSFDEFELDQWKTARTQATNTIPSFLNELKKNEYISENFIKNFFRMKHPFDSHYSRFLEREKETTIEEARWFSALYNWTLENFSWNWELAHGCFFNESIFSNQTTKRFRDLIQNHQSLSFLSHLELNVWSLLSGSGSFYSPSLSPRSDEHFSTQSALSVVLAFNNNPIDLQTALDSIEPAWASQIQEGELNGGTLMLALMLEKTTNPNKAQTYLKRFEENQPTYFRLISQGISSSLDKQPISEEICTILRNHFRS